MRKPGTWGMELLFIVVLSISANAKVQCHCPKVPADGEGNTSCSASEAADRCTIDFNLFGRQSEERAAQMLSKYADIRVEPLPNPNLGTDEALKALSSSSQPKQLLDAVLVYLTVALGEQNVKHPDSVRLQDLQELGHAVREGKLAKEIVAAFDEHAFNKWSTYTDEDLRKEKILPSRTDHSVIAPGCMEFKTTNGLWLMFKTSWSAARIWPRCESSAE